MSNVAARSNAEAAEAVSAAGRQPTVERAAMAIASSWSAGFVHGELAFWDYDREVWSRKAPDELIEACGADDESWPYVENAVKKLCDLKQTKMATSEQIVAAKLPDTIARTIAVGHVNDASPLGDDFKSLRAAIVESMRSERPAVIPGCDDFKSAESLLSLVSGTAEKASLFPKQRGPEKWAPGKAHMSRPVTAESMELGLSGDKLILSLSQSASLAVIPDIDKPSFAKKYPKTLSGDDAVAWLKSKSNTLTSDPSELVKVIMASISPDVTVLPNTAVVAAYYGLLELTGGATDYSARALSLVFAKLFEKHGFKPLQAKPRRLSAYIADGLFDMSALGFLEMTPAVVEAREANAPSRALSRA